MITLNVLRTAALSERPWTALDALVRVELASGRLTRAIYDDIIGLQEELRQAPDYSEEADDAIGDTLDLLIGFCPAGREYKNPPILPTEEEIAVLPRWARVAFAVRCAWRVLPLYVRIDQPRWLKHSRVLMDVLDVASDAADAAELPQSFAAIREDISHIATAGWTNLDKLGQAEYPTGGYLLVRTVWHVAHTADTNQFTTRFTTRSADYAAMKAAEAAGFSVTPAIRRDFDHLSQLAEAQRWDDDTPVSPGVFGPLWPEGLPKGWPVASHIPQWTELVVEAFACERATEKMLEDDLVNLFHVLNRYYIVRSGSRLTLDQFNSLLPALVPAEV